MGRNGTVCDNCRHVPSEAPGEYTRRRNATPNRPADNRVNTFYVLQLSVSWTVQGSSVVEVLLGDEVAR